MPLGRTTPVRTWERLGALSSMKRPRGRQEFSLQTGRASLGFGEEIWCNRRRGSRGADSEGPCIRAFSAQSGAKLWAALAPDCGPLPDAPQIDLLQKSLEMNPRRGRPSDALPPPVPPPWHRRPLRQVRQGLADGVAGARAVRLVAPRRRPGRALRPIDPRLPPQRCGAILLAQVRRKRGSASALLHARARGGRPRPSGAGAPVRPPSPCATHARPRLQGRPGSRPRARPPLGAPWRKHRGPRALLVELHSMRNAA